LPDISRPAPPNEPQAGLVQRMQHHTRVLHLKAERSGVVRDLLRGKATIYGYALLLRNLLPAYQQLESGLERHAHSPDISVIVEPVLFRSDAICADLDQIHGEGWRRALPVLAAAERYADRVAGCARDGGAGLVAHAYVRYMGDLSGGRILQRVLARSLPLTPGMLSFYDFPEIGDIEAFKSSYRSAFDRVALPMADLATVVEEAAEAFRLNIAVSMEVAASAAQTDAGR
jgi:heme oxygenase (biliverdin-producing, ferredoxin)